MTELAAKLWDWETRGVALEVTRDSGCSPEAVLSVCHGERLSRDEHVYLTEHLDEATWMLTLWQQSLESVQ